MFQSSFVLPAFLFGAFIEGTKRVIAIPMQSEEAISVTEKNAILGRRPQDPGFGFAWGPEGVCC
jgi:hypothetical protein